MSKKKEEGKKRVRLKRLTRDCELHRVRNKTGAGAGAGGSCQWIMRK